MARRDRSRLRPAFAPLPYADVIGRCSSGLVVDAERGVARWRGREVAISAREQSLLALLIGHPGRLITPDEIGRHAWGEPLASRESVTSTVKRCRARLRALDFPETSLTTVRALGYRWDQHAQQPGIDALDVAG